MQRSALGGLVLVTVAAAAACSAGDGARDAASERDAPAALRDAARLPDGAVAPPPDGAITPDAPVVADDATPTPDAPSAPPDATTARDVVAAPDVTSTPDGGPPPPPPATGAPRLFFTDLESGPNTGGEGGNGVFVTIYGSGFDAGSAVTVGGGAAIVRSAPAPYLWYQRVVVQLGPAARTGDIVVTNARGASNPLPFTVRAGAIYFVATAGSDGAAGTFAAPWRTLVHAVHTAGAGATIYAMNGVTQSTDDGESWDAALTLRAEWCQGTAAAPKALVAYPGATVTIGSAAGHAPGNGVRSTDGSASGGACRGNWVIAQIDLRGDAPVAIDGPSDNWRVVGCDVSNPMASGGGGGGAAFETSQATHVRGLGNHGHDLNTASTDRLQQGFYLSTDSNHAELGWNLIERARGRAGIQVHSSPVAAGTGYAMFDIGIHDNVVHDIAEEGILVDTVDPSRGPVGVYNNVVYNVGQDGNSNGAIYRAASSDFDTSRGVGTGAVEVYNNTIFAYAGGPAFGGSFEVHTGQALVDRLRNNLILSTGAPYFAHESSDPAYHSCASTDTAASCANFVGANNLLFGAGAPTFAALVTGSINRDPMLANVAARDAHLRAGSPAIDAAARTTPAAATDADGVPRPQGAAPDIGAFEYHAP